MANKRFAQNHQTGLTHLIQVWSQPHTPSPRDAYLRHWRLVKRARFNAAKRFERKHCASTFAFAFAGIIGFLVPFYTLLFKDSLSAHTKNVFDFTAYVAGALSLILGIIEQAKNYPARSKKFDACGRRVNAVFRRLTHLPHGHDKHELDDLVAEYEAALDECQENNDDIDLNIAKAQEDLDQSGGTSARRALARLKLVESLQIYCTYICVWITPMLIGIVLWWTLHPDFAQ